MHPNQNKHTFAGLERPSIIAHRGSSAYAPENTLAAFKLAIEQGAHGIELDAKLTSDGQVVVIHDQTVDRTTNGTGQVDRMTLAELQSLDAGTHFDASFKGERLPSLAQVFASLGKHTFIMVELKNNSTPRDALPEHVAALVQEFALETSVLLSSFNPIALCRVSRLLPEVPLGLLTFGGKKGAWNRSWIGGLIPHQVLHPAWRDANRSLINKNHQRGYQVIPYVVNDKAVMQDLFSAGVDGIITDNPPLAIRTLAEMNSEQILHPGQA